MRIPIYILLTISILSFFTRTTAQAQSEVLVKRAELNFSKAGTFYASWGWNEDRYNRSDIRFIGDDYDFRLTDVKAVQRQKKFTVNDFLNPLQVSIPQFNFRLGYYVKDDLDFFIGLDHMKYVVPAGQIVGISGHIRNTETIYDGVYNDDVIQITDDFLDFEHTDGLNYVHVGARKSHTFISHKWISLGAYETFSLGVMRPRSDVTLIGKPRHNKYNIAGLAFAAGGGLELYLWRHFFLQSELKGGFTTMPWVRTTNSKSDKAIQNFWFGQAIVQFGGRWSIKKRKG